MPIRNPTEVERDGLIELRQEQLQRSYGRGLARPLLVLAVAGVVTLVAVLVARAA